MYHTQRHRRKGKNADKGEAQREGIRVDPPNSGMGFSGGAVLLRRLLPGGDGAWPSGPGAGGPFRRRTATRRRCSAVISPVCNAETARRICISSPAKAPPGRSRPPFRGRRRSAIFWWRNALPVKTGKKNWKVTYLARVDEEGEWDPEGKQERQICQYPCLVMTGKGWRIETLQGRAGEPRPFFCRPAALDRISGRKGGHTTSI